jgi:hypothetical protein
MNSGAYPFEQILQRVSIETGIKNLRPHFNDIVMLVADAEKEINPYAGFLLKKKMVHFVGNGVFDGTSIKKPKDFVELDKVGSCEDGLCPGSYFENVSHIIICDKQERTKITWTYWALQFDGNGYPVVSYNHSEAVIAFIIWKLYASKVFMGEGNFVVKRDMQMEWENRCMEARGEDFMPGEDQMLSIYGNNRMGSIELLEKTLQDYCKSCESCLTIIEEPMEPVVGLTVYFWQINSPVLTITDEIPLITEEYVEGKPSALFDAFQQGYVVNYTTVGRIAFAIKETELVTFQISDALNNDVTDAFDLHYFEDLKTMLYVSINPYVHSSIYFKFKKLNNV